MGGGEGGEVKTKIIGKILNLFLLVIMQSLFQHHLSDEGKKREII